MVSKNKLKSSENFYNNISTFYDEMVSFSSALQRRKDLIKKFITANTHSAADLGCGTGMDSIALAMKGINVTGFDISAEMISKAIENAKTAGLDISFQKSGIEKIPGKYFNKYDLAVSLGNSLANIDEKSLNTGISKIYKLLKDKGVVVIQILNYSKIINSGERIVNINSNQDSIFIRFYDFLPLHINFNILKINKLDYSQREFHTTLIYPHDRKVFSNLLKKNKFKKIKFYGNLDLKPYDRNTSNDLVVVAEK